jgi:hypothetical protein
VSNDYIVIPGSLMKENILKASRLISLCFALLVAMPLTAQQKVNSATGAGPTSLSQNATVQDWDGNVLREGTNGWTCLPDRSDTPGEDPWCVNQPWLNFIDALVSEKQPSYDQVGIAYMLKGDTGVSNTDPYATGGTNDADWVEGLGAHLMILVPDRSSFTSLSTDPNNGGPWIMWPDTPYAHIMIPVDSYPD